MNQATQFYKEMHPNQFSDSQIIQSAELDRTFMDYYLSTIASKSLEKNFEKFCKRIIEMEVCPNLIPQTGPTGGGDSKVDSESYPVSESLTESWFYGEGNKSGSERWAFAFSAKHDWKPKVKSDIKKIVDTNASGRGYTKIFFVSNQEIPDKKRAEVEDELRLEYKLDIRIFDRNWLLDKVFSSDANKRVAVECFSLSEKLIDKKKIGENDYRRQNRLEEVECSLKSLSDLNSSEIIAFARESVELSRELEVDVQKILGLLERYLRLAREYGTSLDQANALYECAWTIFWWYPDNNRFYDYYTQFEALTVSMDNPYLFQKLITLWINLFNLHSKGFDVNIDAHKDKINSLYKVLTADENMPNRTLHARAAYQLIRLFGEDNIEDVVKDYIDIVQKSNGSLEVDLLSISKIICDTPILQTSPSYDELFELIVATLAREKENAEASRMLAKRGHQIAKSQPYRGIEYFSRTLSGFYNESNRHNLVSVIIEMADLFEQIGLFWAARNYYMNALSYSISQYMKTGEVSIIFALAAYKLKWLELLQGRVIYAAEMHVIESIAKSLYPRKLNIEDDKFEACLACECFLTPFEQIHHLDRLPSYFDNRGLPLAAIAAKYELGYYDEDMLSYHNGNKEKYDQFISEWQNQPLLEQIRYKPWYGFEEKCTLESKILGCHFILYAENNAFIIEFATSLLAALECFLGTGFSHSILSGVGKFSIDVQSRQADGFSVKTEYSRDNPTYMKLCVSAYRQDEFVGAQEKVSNEFVRIISTIVSVILISNDDFEKLKTMVENEAALYRTKMFANSLFSVWSVFGEDAFSFNSLMEPYDGIKMLRTEPLMYPRYSPKTTKSHNIKYEAPPVGADFSSISNENIITSDIINIPLWNLSGWTGALYAIPLNSEIPLLAFIFKSRTGLKIFEEWKKMFGNDDAKSAIGIRIIKGISRKEPFSYRIAIGINSIDDVVSDNRGEIILTPSRIHTIQPQDDTNLKRFENACNDLYYICPAIMAKETDNPEIHQELSILKHKDSIRIISAYETSSQDVLAISSFLPDDDPFLPEGKDHSEIIKIIERKRQTKSDNS